MEDSFNLGLRIQAPGFVRDFSEDLNLVLIWISIAIEAFNYDFER